MFLPIRRSTPLVITALTAVSISFLGVNARLTQIRNSSTPAKSEKAAVSRPAAAGHLAAEIERVINESNLNQARWGVFVMSLRDGRVLCSRNGDELFTPASNMKVYTTAVALDLVGASYRWRTSVYAEKEPAANGLIDGDLILFGRGAPDLVSMLKGNAPSLAGLADQLYQRGVREVRGSVIGDSSYFRGERYGFGWQWNDLQWYYGAEPSALTIDGNAANLVITPGAKPGDNAILKLDRGAGYLHLINSTTTGGRSAVTTIGINREVSDHSVQVWGELPLGGRSFGAFLSVPGPELWAATLFQQLLVAKGIKVDGDVRSRDFRVADDRRFDPTTAIELAGVDSETLGEVVRETNKQSKNLEAELILRTLGKEKGATAPDSDPRRNAQRGDDEAGVAVISSWLKSHEIDADKLAIRDGSGLSRLDLVTPESTVRLLAAIAKTNSASIFHDSLPIAGRDGTLGGRLSNVAGRIFGKTGTVFYVHSLSGYAAREDGEVLAFAIFCNDALGRGNPIRTIDQIASLIAVGSRPG
jgi:serine-type D-Ala-D-Ala carboxypeptidase/endopeptidase (penicillin-binding protein 4)